MAAPRFSVIIPTLNEEKFLPNLLSSLVQQSEKPFEVIVVDGKSKDKTVAVAESFKRKLPLRVIACERASIPLQRNTGARHARGAWLIFIDADSVLLPYFFDRVERFITREKPSFFTTWFRPDSETGGDALVILFGNALVEGSILTHRPAAPGPLTVVQRNVFYSVDGYDVSRAWAEDYDFTRRVSEQGVPLAILRETLYVYSLRRFRKNKMKTIQAYAKAVFLVLLTKKAPRDMPGYVMGGQVYANHS